jgi:pimeloyl-ACP methyl ester carboxylesterase/class 3 adenylate cyclase
MPPETKYAKSGSISIAYQVVGDGPRDLVLVPGWVSHVEYAWEDPWFSAFLRRLSSFCRLIVLDRRGTGLSDRVTQLPTLEERMDDVRAVMDAAGSERAVLFGISEGGPMCMLFAATYPQRTAALALYGTFAKNVRDAEHPWAHPPEEIQRWLQFIERHWGSGLSARMLAPSLADDEQFVSSWARFERFAVSPGGARVLLQIVMDSDVSEILPSIRVPTLILHRRDDSMTHVEGARYIARRIPGAKYVELPGSDHFGWVGDVEPMLGEVEEFVTGARHTPEPDRVLATVLFTDIVDSTAQANKMEDARWRALLEQYYGRVRRELDRFNGKEISTAGDGFLASFDGPARGIRCACAIRDAVATLGIKIRAGLHTGECEAIGADLGGIAVHIGARVAALAAAGEVLVSSTVKDLVAGSGLRFADRGLHSLKGLPNQWRLYVVEA